MVTATPGIIVPRPDLRDATFHLVGTSPLICHRFAEKAKRQMLDKQMKKAVGPKSAKDPEVDYQDSLYPMPDGDGYGFPAIAFKASMVGSARFLGLKMTEMRGAFHVPGELVRIIGEPQMREDMVRLQGNTADIRYRGQFDPWEVHLTIRYNAGFISQEQLANLLVTAGFSQGIGEWRPERDGSNGMWELA